MPKVSVVVPVYNEEKYLNSCLESLINQSLTDIEIIIVDDGSTDKSREIEKEYAEADGRISVLKQMNQYAGAARNRGMDVAQGKYIIFLDADDWYSEYFLEKMYTVAEKWQSEIALCNFFMYDDSQDKQKIPDIAYKESFLPEQSTFCGQDLKYNGIFQFAKGWAWDKLFNLDFLRRNGLRFQKIRSSNDGYFTFMALAIANNITYLKDRLVTYRVGNQYSISNARDKSWENGFVMIESIHDDLCARDLYEIYEQSFLNWVVEYIVWYVDSLNSLEAVKGCFRSINALEDKYMLRKKDAEFFLDTEKLNYYLQITENDFDAFLFWRMMYFRNLNRVRSRDGWTFPFFKVERNRKIAIFGAGTVGKDYVRQLIRTRYHSELWWFDNNLMGSTYEGILIRSPKELHEFDYDYVVIAVAGETTKSIIRAQLIQDGIDDAVII